MLRKSIFGMLALTAVGGLFLGGELFSYARTGMSAARHRIRAEVPVEFEIERARQEVERLLPQVRKSMHLMAEEQVEVAQLRQSIARREKHLANQEQAILSLTADLKSKEGKFQYAGHQYRRDEVEKDLAERFKRFKIAEETVRQERQVLGAKESALTVSRETLEGMLSQRKTLEAQLERLEARLRTVQARKEIHGLHVDNSHLARVQTLISQIEKRLDVEDAVLAAEGDLNGLIPVDQKDEAVDARDLTSEVESYFDRPVEERSSESQDF